MKCSPEQLAHSKRYYEAHKEQERARAVAYSAAHREERRAYYQAHREQAQAYQTSHYEANKEELSRKRAWFIGNLNILKAAQGCDECGASEGRLDHHHTDPTTKKYSVSQMCNNSLETFMDEIAKCIVLCKSCHSGRHVEMRALAA